MPQVRLQDREDELDPAVELVKHGELDVIVFECVGERTLAFGHRDRQADPLSRLPAGGIGAVGGRHAQAHPLADELERSVAHQRAGQQPRFRQHLEAVADREDRATGSDERPEPIAEADGDEVLRATAKELLRTLDPEKPNDGK